MQSGSLTMRSIQRFEWRRPILIGWTLAAAVALYVFPPFHVRPIQRAVEAVATPGAIDVPRFAQNFWSQKLVAPAVRPVDAHLLVAALKDNPVTAMKKYGHRAGIGGKAYFLVAGEGRVTSVDERGVWFDVTAANAIPLLLITGPVFGNALRDVTGLLPIADFSPFDFNALGAELNRLAETRAQPELLNGVSEGSTLAFIAAGEFDDATTEQPILKLVPIRVTPRS